MGMRDWSDPAYQRLCMDHDYDRTLSSLPVCPDCGRPITSEQCMPIEEDGYMAYLCEDCVKGRMVWTEDVA